MFHSTLTLSPRRDFAVSSFNAADAAYWNNTLEAEYPLCIGWINDVENGADRITLPVTYLVCDVVRSD